MLVSGANGMPRTTVGTVFGISVPWRRPIAPIAAALASALGVSISSTM
jgi:hypothetical protein